MTHGCGPSGDSGLEESVVRPGLCRWLTRQVTESTPERSSGLERGAKNKQINLLEIKVEKI